MLQYFLRIFKDLISELLFTNSVEHFETEACGFLLILGAVLFGLLSWGFMRSGLRSNASIPRIKPEGFLIFLVIGGEHPLINLKYNKVLSVLLLGGENVSVHEGLGGGLLFLIGLHLTRYKYLHLPLILLVR